VCVAIYTQKFNSNTQGSAKCTFYVAYKTSCTDWMFSKFEVEVGMSRRGQSPLESGPPRLSTAE